MAGKYKPYSEYKDSGVDWLGAVPATWQAMPCRGVVRNIVEKNEGALDQNYLSLMANIGVVTYEDKGDVGNKKPEDLSKCKIVKKGNLVINSMNYAIGSYGMSAYDGVCSPVYIVLDANDSVLERRFALRVFENKPFQKYLSTFGNGILEHRAAIGWDDIKGAYIAVPSKDEQLAILNFLDHETAKIDTLIEKQKQLIQLLKEKRHAVISHAVTKGLNPNAKMKDSGVEWLGEVPESWIVSRVKFEYKNLDGQRIPLSAEERSYKKGEYPYYGASGIIDHVDDYIFNEDLVLVSEDGANLLMRTYAIAFPAHDKYWVNNHAHILKPKDNNTEYWAEVIEVRDLTPYISGSAQPKFTSEALSNLEIAVPSTKDEVEEVASYIRKQKEKYSILMAKAENSIQLMQERRAALISAAVTGKIDVRNWVAAKENQANREVAA